MRSRVRGAAALALCGAVVSGCSSAVQVDPPSPVSPSAGRVAVDCAAVMQQLPATVDGQRRRTTTPDPEHTAAWGDPAVVLRCPVGAPAAYSPTSQLVVVNGVAWLAEPTDVGVRFTAMQVRADTSEPVLLGSHVEVSVPSAYRPEAELLPGFSRPVDAGAGVS